jgi:hypothetical protein
MLGLVLRLLALHEADQPDELAAHLVGEGEVVVGRHGGALLGMLAEYN